MRGALRMRAWWAMSLSASPGLRRNAWRHQATSPVPECRVVGTQIGDLDLDDAQMRPGSRPGTKLLPQGRRGGQMNRIGDQPRAAHNR